MKSESDMMDPKGKVVLQMELHQNPYRNPRQIIWLRI